MNNFPVKPLDPIRFLEEHPLKTSTFGYGSLAVLRMRLASSVFGGMAGLDLTNSEVGVIGLDVTGWGVAANLADHQFEVAACHWEKPQTPAPPAPGVRLAASARELIPLLRRPRTILIFSGDAHPANSIAEELLPDLRDGDLLMDAGNSYFKDTARLSQRLTERGIRFMGLGLAGGQEGSRQGAIVMAGGGRQTRERTRPLLGAMAASVRGEPCLCHLETAAAAHFAKMVHAGIENALLQLVCDTLELLQRALLLTHEELHDASGAWHIGVLNGYLMEITGRVFEPVDKQSARLLLQERLASARSDALGRWVTQSALELGVPIPTIEAAVESQHLAAAGQRQALLAAPFRHPVGRFGDDSESVLDELHGALHAAMMIAYAQGMALLIAGSQHLGFQFNLHEIFRAWRGCTCLRTTLLDDIAAALQATPDLPGLLCDDDLSEGVMACQENLRHAVWRAHQLDAPAPALLASLDYLDSNREAWLPVNLIQVAPHSRQGHFIWDSN